MPYVIAFLVGFALTVGILLGGGRRGRYRF